MRYFAGSECIEDLRKSFRALCMRLHPDKGGKHEEFVEMINEYDYLCGNPATKAA